MTCVISIESVSKLYRLGMVGTGTFAHDLNRWWHLIRGKQDPYEKIGTINDRSLTAEQRRTDDEPSRPKSILSRLSAAAEPECVWALKDIDLEVQQGDIVGIIGSNGAGKSTLLKLLSRVTAPTTGEIRIRGRTASLLEVGTGFHPELTGRENIYLNGTILGMSKRDIDRHFEDIVEFSEIGAFIDTPVKRYSSGMYVRLAFAVAAHLEPEILIVDEVLAVGDVAFQRKCLGKMSDVAEHGRTVLFVSHNMQAIRILCKSAIWLQDGTVRQRGKSEQVVAAYLQAATTCEGLEDVANKIAALPRHRAFQLHNIKVSQDGQVTTSVVTGQAVEVTVDYSVLSRSPGLHVWFLLYDGEGSIVFDSINNGDSTDLPIVERGRYRSVVTIPANFLAARRYEIGISAGIHNLEACVPEPLRVSIDVEHTGLVNRAYPGYAAPGKLAPLLEWSNKCLSAAAAEEPSGHHH